MTPRDYKQKHKIKKYKDAVLTDYHAKAFSTHGISWVIYETQDSNLLLLDIPADFNERYPAFSIEWGSWLKNIEAFETTLSGIRMLVKIKKNMHWHFIKIKPAEQTT